ncbi:MAG: phosphoribosylformylglycinamidine synthase subunit PurS [Armatimonadetes bacterium]|nr:phosphoribosylformylglycinamidine synthase subunit PurS [Armatimonadota bacterium]
MPTVRIVVTLKPGVLDAQGQAIRQGLHALGFDEVAEVRVGRYLEIDLPEGWSRERVDAMCDQLLAHPLIEQYTIGAGGNPGTGAEAPGPAGRSEARRGTGPRGKGKEARA